jgi:hypothetical protein
MRILDTDEARQILSMYPYLRVSDIPVEGMLLHKEMAVVSSDSEGQVTVFSLEPGDDE